MARARKPCSTPGCPHLQPCPDHPKIAWAGSTRRTRTISGSAQQKRARWVLHYYDHMCHVCGKDGAEEADHVTPLAEGGPDTVENMRPIHIDCHKAKTAHEAAHARTTRGGG